MGEIDVRDVKEKLEELKHKAQKKGVKWIVFGVVAILLLIFSSKIAETFDKGTYQIRQAAFFGWMNAKKIGRASCRERV